MLLQGHFKRFRANAVNPDNARKLFVMIVDECHYGATLQQAHDTYVNDYNWLDGSQSPQHGPKKDKLVARPTGKAQLLQQDNVLTLLVSATPYSMLTCSSRLPESMFVPPCQSEVQYTLANERGLKALDVLKKQGSAWCLEPTLPSSASERNVLFSAQQVQELLSKQVKLAGKSVFLDLNVFLDKCLMQGRKPWHEAHTQVNRCMQVLKELHVLDWNACDAQKVPYRRIEDYVASMSKPKADQHGIVNDSQFDQKFEIARSVCHVFVRVLFIPVCMLCFMFVYLHASL